MQVYKDGRIAHYKDLFPNVSFPTSGPDDSFLTSQNAYKVNAFKEYNKSTQKLVPAAPYIENGWAYTVQVVNKTEEDIAAETASKAASKRAERNRLLKESDWTQVSDAPVDKEAWATYRQALRDLPDHPNFPSVEMPRSPDWVDPVNYPSV